jgi:mannose/fructose/N-acetylgalactosamine-specific phosphotransferase system component IIC
MILQAILFALAVTLWGNFINSPYFVSFLGMMPLTAGVITGVILGEPETGLIAGGFIQVAYLGWVSAGGALPSNMFLAGYYGVALTILAGADPETAPALAIPVGLLGVFVHQAQMTINAFFVHRADRYAEEGNFRGIQMMNAVAPLVLNLILYGIPSFFLVQLGADVAPDIFESIPPWLVDGLNIVGSLMPALGIAMLLNYMGKKHLMPFFFIGFFMVVYLGLSLNAVAVFGALVAIFYYFSKMREGAMSHG